MKRKIVILLVVVLMLAIMSFVFCACNNEESITELDYVEKLHNEGYIIRDYFFKTLVGTYEGTTTADPSTRQFVYTCLYASKESSEGKEYINIDIFEDNISATEFWDSEDWLKKLKEKDDETIKCYIEDNKIIIGTIQACEVISNVTSCDKGYPTPTEYFKKMVMRGTDDYYCLGQGYSGYSIDSIEEQKSIDFPYYYRGSGFDRSAIISFFFDSNDANAKYSELKEEYSKDGYSIVLKDKVLIYGTTPDVEEVTK